MTTKRNTFDLSKPNTIYFANGMPSSLICKEALEERDVLSAEPVEGWDVAKIVIRATVNPDKWAREFGGEYVKTRREIPTMFDAFM